MYFRIFRNRKRILVLDDPARAAEVVRVLQKNKFEATPSQDLSQLSPLLASFKPDAILVGISFPDQIGMDYLRRLHSLHIKEPVVVISDNPSPETRIHARAYGAIRFRKRPLSRKRLINLLKRVIEGYEGKFTRRVFPASREEAELFRAPAGERTAEDSLRAITNPRSIIVVGASESPGKASERRTRSLLEGGFDGNFYPVNPKRDTIFGHQAYKSVRDIPDDDIDLSVLIVRREHLLQSVQESCEKGVKAIIAITAGVGESDEGGKFIEDEMLRIAATTGTRIIGPNCSGMYSASGKVNLLGLPGITPGPFSVIAQSGNVIDSLCYYAAIRKRGFSTIFSAGNAIGFSFHDYLHFLKNDEHTRVILLYLEGIREGVEFLEAARSTVPEKPIIAIKVGNSEAGIRAAASHTGSIASSKEIIDVGFQQAGIIRTTNVDEMFELAEVLADCPVPQGNRVAIVSEGGGDNAIAAENAERFRLRVPLLSQKAQQRVRKHLLEGMPAHNPIDYGGVAEENPLVIKDVVKTCLETGEVDSIVITGFYGGFSELIADRVASEESEAARGLLNVAEQQKKPIVVHSSFARSGIEPLEILRRGRLPVFESSERAMQSLAALVEYSHSRVRFEQESLLEFPELSESEHSKVHQTLKFAEVEERSSLLETESRRILEIYNLPVNAAKLARSVEELNDILSEYTFPVAMKIVSRNIIHKSDVGGVRLNLQNAGEAFSAYREILENAKNVTSVDRIEGVLVAPMVASGAECIVGMVRDPVFGPVLMFGMGGVFVEALKDTSFSVLPLLEGDVSRMIEKTIGHTILKGYRGNPPADIEALARIIEGIARISKNHPEILEIDLNPVIVHEQGATIVDSRFIL